MKPSPLFPALPAALLPLLLAGCVTINIYFPASAAEKAADKIIDDIWQTRGAAAPDGVASPAPPTPPKAAPNDKPEKP
jgi:hypothetical protein